MATVVSPDHDAAKKSQVHDSCIPSLLLNRLNMANVKHQADSGDRDVFIHVYANLEDKD